MDNDNVVEGPWNESKEKAAAAAAAAESLSEDIKKIINNPPLEKESPDEYKNRVFGKKETSEAPTVDSPPVWSCKACGYQSKKDERVLSLNMGNAFQVIICPNCHTLQLPNSVYEEFKEMMDSNILRPNV